MPIASRSALAALVSSCLVSTALITSAACFSEASFEVSHSSTASGRLVNGAPADEGIARSALYFEAGESACSGVRVGPRHILTAAHCVVVMKDGVLTSKIQPALAAGQPLLHAGTQTIDALADLRAATIASTSVPPAMRAACARGCAVDAMWEKAIPDIALITVREDLDASIATALVDAGTLLDGDEVLLTGYGCTDGSWALPGGAELRVGTSTVLSDDAANDGAQEWFEGRFPSSAGYAVTAGASFGGTSSSTTPATCPGDSGGPLYRGRAAPFEAERVVGVNSGIFFDGAAISRLNYHTRIESGAGVRSPVADWLGRGLPFGAVVP